MIWRNKPGSLAGLLPPECCALCEAPVDAPSAFAGPLCAGCACALPWVGPCCRGCALPLSGSGADWCGRCLRAPLPFEEVIAGLRYVWPADRLVLAAKFGSDLTAVRVLASALAHAVDSRGDLRPQALVAVPLHWRRSIGRGYNQSLELARVLGARLGLPVERALVRRIRHTPPQSTLAGSRRSVNLRGAFAARPGGGLTRVAVVDDVLTTGATAAAVAEALRVAGVHQVLLWCATRAGSY